MQRDGVVVEAAAPERGQEGRYCVQATDRTSALTMHSVVNNELTAFRWQTALQGKRETAHEREALWKIYAEHVLPHQASEKTVWRGKEFFESRLTFQCDCLEGTPYSGYTVRNGEDELFGHIEMLQGPGQNPQILEKIKRLAPSCGIDPKDVYTPSENDVALDLRLSLSEGVYPLRYTECVRLALKVVQIFNTLGFKKRENSRGPQDQIPFFNRPTSAVRRVTISLEEFSKGAAAPLHLMEEARQLESLVQEGVLQRFGVLLPKAFDVRNMLDTPVRVYGINI